MCGRYTLKTPTPKLADHFAVELDIEVEARFNIAPTTEVLVIDQPADRRQAELLRWGLIPSWSKDDAAGGRLANARSETAAEKPSFRLALRHRRCLIPADGFYEWRTEGGAKQPYYFTRPDDEVFAFGGLWETWKPRNAVEPGRVIHSCTILTTSANRMMGEYHDRMPVIIPPDQYDLWLDPRVIDPAAIASLLTPLPEEALLARPVNKFVNSVRNQGPDCIAVLASPNTLFS
jgi:putative SOS response-associated peptidase YedK